MNEDTFSLDLSELERTLSQACQTIAQAVPAPSPNCRGSVSLSDWKRVNVERPNEVSDERAALEEVRRERTERRQAKVRERIRAALDTLGEDTYDEHAVLRFTKTFKSGDFTYAAIKANDLWYVTGRFGDRHRTGVTWDNLTIWLVAGKPVTELTLMTPAPASTLDVGVSDPESEAEVPLGEPEREVASNKSWAETPTDEFEPLTQPEASEREVHFPRAER